MLQWSQFSFLYNCMAAAYTVRRGCRPFRELHEVFITAIKSRSQSVIISWNLVGSSRQSEGLLKGGFARRVVAATGAHLQPGLVRKDFDRAKTPVGLEVGRLIAEHIFTAQCPLDFSEASGELPACMCWQDLTAGGTG